MNALVPMPTNGRARSFRVDFTCSCGRGRAILVKNLRNDLPLGADWRLTGPCPACGRQEPYKFTQRPQGVLVTVRGEGDGG